MGDAEGRREDHGVDVARRLLRRRLRVRTEKYHLGRGARPSGGDLHPQPLPGRTRDGASEANYESHQPEDGNQRVELSQRLQSGSATEDASRRADAAIRKTEYRSRA